MTYSQINPHKCGGFWKMEKKKQQKIECKDGDHRFSVETSKCDCLHCRVCGICQAKNGCSNIIKGGRNSSHTWRCEYPCEIYMKRKSIDIIKKVYETIKDNPNISMSSLERKR